MVKLKVVYFGTPDFSAELLKKLVEDTSLPIEILGVVTQPDKKVGRKQILTPSPVKKVAGEYKLSLNPDLKSADLALLFAYGEILPKEILSLPRYGFWNVHPSLLPLYRGASPVATPLLNGDVETGVTIMKMDELLDHGSIISQQKSYIFPLQRRDQLTERLVDLAYEMLGELFGKYAGNMDGVVLTEQDHSQATFTQKLSKEDGYVEVSKLKLQISNSSKQLFNLFRGLYPWPGIWTTTLINGREQRIKITKLHWEEDKIVVKNVQIEGKNEMDYETFCRAYPNIL